MTCRLRSALGALAIALSVSSALASERDQRLVDAAERRDTPAVAALLKQHVDVNARQPDGATALHWAAHWDDQRAADLLICAGADVNATNDYGVTPLALAAINGSDGMIRTLLRARANANATLPTGETALMTAARAGSSGAVDALVTAGANVNAKQITKGQTALMWAVAEKHIDVARTLIDRGADVTARTNGGFTPLLFAAREGNLELVRLLLSRGADVNDSSQDGSTPLLVATVRGHVELALFLLERGARPDGQASAAGYTPLHWAAGTFESVITRYYPDAPGEWAALPGIPLRDAKLALIRALIARGADVNTRVTKDPPRYGYFRFNSNHVRQATPFLLATTVADIEVMRLLLAHGAEATVTTADRTTALLLAAGMAGQENQTRVPERDHLAAVRLIVELGADVNGANNSGLTPMHAAARMGLETVLQFLVDRGAFLNPKTKDGQTPLGVAEGHRIGGSYSERPNAAALLRRLGAVSEGAVKLRSETAR